MRRTFFIFCVGLVSASSSFAAPIGSPIGFTAGQPISSSQMNTNFTTVFDAIRALQASAGVPLIVSTLVVDQVVTIPPGVTTLMVELIGGGGGAGAGNGETMPAAGGAGGVGGYGKVYLPVVATDVVTITVGKGGAGATAPGACLMGNSPAGGFGGDSVLKKNGTVIMTAGGGVGGGGAYAMACPSGTATTGTQGVAGSVTGAMISISLSHGTVFGKGGWVGTASSISPAGDGGSGNDGAAIVTFY